ncbi:MAG: hypothetical protein ABII79_12530 [bacterium]
MTRMVTLTATLITLLLAPLATAEVPQTINYQGRLTDGSGPVTATVAMTFTIYDAEIVGNSKWTETHPSVSVTDGLFNVVLGAGTPAAPVEDTVFSGADRWLEITVGGETIVPRTKMASNPYAFQSNWTLVGEVLYTSSEWGIVKAGNTLYGSFGKTHVNLGWGSTTGEPGFNRGFCTVSGGEHNTASGEYSTVGGGLLNTASGMSSTIGGGGDWGLANTASESYSTVGGGGANTASEKYSTVGGGRSNTASGDSSTVAGGAHNTADGAGSTIGGGIGNSVTFDWGTVSGGKGNTAAGVSVVAGGLNNDASNQYASIGGGQNNVTLGAWSAIPGGLDNNADGIYSFAAGRRAKANHSGTFVWADGTDADFSSTASDQFLVRASGGVGIGTTSPQGALDVSSTTGALIVPRITTAQRDALTAVNGMIIYNTTTNQFNFYENGAWVTK